MAESINFLDPNVLSGLDNLELRARVVVEVFVRAHKSESGIQRRIQRLPPLSAWRRSASRRLEALCQE